MDSAQCSPGERWAKGGRVAALKTSGMSLADAPARMASAADFWTNAQGTSIWQKRGPTAAAERP